MTHDAILDFYFHVEDSYLVIEGNEEAVAIKSTAVLSFVKEEYTWDWTQEIVTLWLGTLGYTHVDGENQWECFHLRHIISQGKFKPVVFNLSVAINLTIGFF